MCWLRVADNLWRRLDGAEVALAETAALGKGDARGWVAVGPNMAAAMPRRRRLDRNEVRPTARRFGTAGAARAAVDAEFPLQTDLLFQS